MKLSAFKIYIIFTVLTLLGIFVIPKLALRLNPSINPSSINVSYYWQGADSYSLEREVTSVLESGFATIKGLENMSSRSSKGYGSITLDFDKYTKIDIARFEVSAVLRRLYKKLPTSVAYPVIIPNHSDEDNLENFLTLSINANESLLDIQKKTLSVIAPVLGSIEGVEGIKIYGAEKEEFLLRYDLQQLNLLKISKKHLINAIQKFFSRESLGQVYLNDRYSTVTIFPNDSIDWHLPVISKNGRIIYLDQLVKISKQGKEPQSYFRVNGENAISLVITAKKNVNIIKVSNRIDNELHKLKELLPSSYNVLQTYDSSEFLSEELQKIYKRSLYAIMLLVFILMISHTLRYLVVVILTIIANLGIAVLLYYAFNIEIQLYSLAGITISLGLIIDNVIITTDHIMKKGVQNIFTPLLASTLTTIGALTTIFFLSEKLKVNLIDFAKIIAINLTVSFLVAWWLVPAILKKMKINLDKGVKLIAIKTIDIYSKYERLILVLLRFKKLTILFLILVFGIPLFMLPSRVENNGNVFNTFYNNTLGSQLYIAKIKPKIDKYLGGTLKLFSQYVFENAYYGRNEQTRLFVNASMEKGGTVHQMNEVFLGLENYISGFSEIKHFNSNIQNKNFGRIEIIFQDQFSESSYPYFLKGLLSRKVLDIGGIDWSIFGVGKAFNNTRITREPINFTIEATGYDYDILNVIADTLKQNLLANSKVLNVVVRDKSRIAKEPSYEYILRMDNNRLAQLKTFPSSIFENLKNLTSSKYEDISLTIDSRYVPIRLESSNSNTVGIWNINNTSLARFDNRLVLDGISNFDKKREDESIYKFNQEYVRLVDIKYAGAAKFGSIFVNEQLNSLGSTLPIGYKFERIDENISFGEEESFSYFILLIFILGIIYIICSILFESFKQPFIIISMIPISFIGVFLTFYLFDLNFDQGGLASFVILSGITVNSVIFIIDSYNKFRKEFPKSSNLKLYLKAFKLKAFPINLTIISTIMGFIPFIMDGQNQVFWFALGAGTIGGLIFSYLGLIFYLPLFTLNKE